MLCWASSCPGLMPESFGNFGESRAPAHRIISLEAVTEGEVSIISSIEVSSIKPGCT